MGGTPAPAMNIEIRECTYIPVFDKFDDDGNVIGEISQEEQAAEIQKLHTHVFLSVRMKDGDGVLTGKSSSFEREDNASFLTALRQATDLINEAFKLRKS
jgi:hypothetical protein